MNFRDRPACRDCVHSSLQLQPNSASDAIRVCLRTKAHSPSRTERMQGPVAALLSGRCGTSGRFFVPSHTDR